MDANTSLTAGSPAGLEAARAERPPGNPTLVVLSYIAVYFLWGSTYLAMHVGVEFFPPHVLAGLRYFTVGILFYPLFRYLSKEKPTPAQWLTACVVGILLCLCGNGTVSWAVRLLPSGIAALLVATVSLWMVLIDWIRPGGHRPRSQVLIGFVLGFAGMVLLVGPKHLGGGERVNLSGALALIVASLAWASGSIYSRHHPLPKSAMLAVGMETLTGGTALLLTAALNGELRSFHASEVSRGSWLSLLYLIIFGSAMGFSGYAYLLKHCPATQVATYAFVNPVVALFLGWLLLDERLNARTLIASGIILTAVLLVILAPQKSPGDELEIPSGTEA